MLARTERHASDSLAAKSPAISSPDITHPTATPNDGKGPAILFADVSKSMQLHERLGDHAARQVIDELLGLARKAVTRQGGRTIKTIGDEILAILPTADAAAQAARELLLEVDACEPRDGVKAGMHVGLHAGAFTERGGDVVGDAVTVAHRLTAYAQSGQILTTAASAGGISPHVRRAMRRLGPLDIRGRRDPIQVEEIAWRDEEDGDATITEAITEVRIESKTLARLVLKIGGRKWKVGTKTKMVAIGRNSCADIPIGNSEASRNHGLIELRNGVYFYKDTSLNGSYVSFGNEIETLVRRSEILLSGQGRICFGHCSGDAGEPLVFRIEAAGH